MSQRILTTEETSGLMKWWVTLDKNRGDRAQLRRAQSPEDILLTPAFSHFLRQMPENWSENKKIRLTDAAMVAAVVARVTKSDPRFSFAKSLASPREGGTKAVMSELRFRQLQKSRSEEEFFTRICRAVDLLHRQANIASLADDILHWLGELRFGPADKPMDRIAVKWASDYYANFKD
ncbi:MAG: type I-E CRISPR-associated protein Cse2/CasB [Gammaproteobacteria bacterium]|nr:type I-E CRISPR-associated protein Cse2/CasB [Gammaproteobacteria bacterium]